MFHKYVKYNVTENAILRLADETLPAMDTKGWVFIDGPRRFELKCLIKLAIEIASGSPPIM